MNNEILLSALDAIDPAELDYPDWIRIGMALKTEGFECLTWSEWSKKDPRYKIGECGKKWEGFSRHDIGGGTIIKMAKDRGWTSPQNNNGDAWIRYFENKTGMKYITHYDYVDLSGKYHHTKVRTLKPDGDKDFYQGWLRDNRWTFSGRQNPLHTKGTIYCASVSGIKKAIEKGEKIFVCEGEKDCITLQKKGFPALTSGAADSWSDKISPLLDGADVIVLADNDGAGKRSAQKIKNSLEGHAKSTKVIIPYPDVEHGDVTDFFDNGGAVEWFETLVNGPEAEIEDSNKAKDQEEPRQNKNPYFIQFNDHTGTLYVDVPLLAKYTRENLTYIKVRDSGKQGLIKDVYRHGVYQYYTDDMFKGCVKDFIAEYDESLVRMNKINEVVQLINTDLDYVTQDQLDADESIINFQNGLLRVTASTTELLPHTPDILSTIQIPCNWTDTPPPTPIFDAYMETLTDGDADIKELLLEFIGAVISNVKGWRMKKALFMVGPGDTGKSQLKSLVEKLVGKGNFIGIDLKEIEARFGTGAIYGTRLAGSSDMSFLSVDELKTFKKITGGDSLFAEFKGQQAFEFTYNGLLWFCMNRLPRFGGDDGQWVYDRILVVNCPNVISPEKQDKQLLDKMYAEREGIVYKAIKALQTVIANGYNFTEPLSVAIARQQYLEANSTVISFFQDCMCEWPDGKIDHECTTGKVYKVYQAWCKQNNNGFAKTAKEFRDGLENHLNVSYSDLTVRIGGNTYYRNYCLTSEARNQFRYEYAY